MVTHDHELATSFADRIVLMKDGRIVNGSER
jgi:ABC-type hemin transport system ATPase subunit